MRYWDASALVPLVVAEKGSDDVRGWLADDPHIVTWVWTEVEMASAVERRTREGSLTKAQRRATLKRIADLAAAWDEVTEVLAVRSLALSLLSRHPLRSADAAQLAAALLVSAATPAKMTFVCLDDNLGTAAEQEGLTPLPTPA